MTQDLDFFQEAMLHITSSLDLPVAVEQCFHFFKRHLPVDALSLHQYVPEERCMKLLFLITESGFAYVERIVPITTQVALDYLNGREERPHVAYISSGLDEGGYGVLGLHSRSVADYVPYKKRGYLVGYLGLGRNVTGHMVFMGDRIHCFTTEHQRLLEMILRPFSLAMANLLNHKRVLDFQERLDAEKLALETENLVLRGSGIIGAGSGLKEVLTAVLRLAGRDIPVLIQGETGTGKELVADAIQRGSPRHGKIFLKVNCGAIPDTLIDSELFGFEKGAFTGATSARAGYFEQADGGTLFLDEVGELPPNVQVRLLRVLQDGMVQRLGSSAQVPVNVRIIAATNRNLESMLQHGAFREDLYYRLNVFPIRVPPLRERTEDLLQLIRHFVAKSAVRAGTRPPEIDPASVERLMRYSWPGNVRELENLVERAITLDPAGPLNLAKYLPPEAGWYLPAGNGQDYLQNLINERVDARVATLLNGLPGRLDFLNGNGGLEPPAQQGHSARPEPPDLVERLDEAMAGHIKKALRQSNGVIGGPKGAAALLDLPPSTLRKRMRKLRAYLQPQ